MRGVEYEEQIIQALHDDSYQRNGHRVERSLQQKFTPEFKRSAGKFIHLEEVTVKGWHCCILQFDQVCQFEIIHHTPIPVEKNSAFISTEIHNSNDFAFFR